MPNYGDQDYWEARYKDQIDRTFDWLQDYHSIKPFITEYLSKDQKILHIGCGNSLLAEEMHSDGYKNLYNIDISKVVIDQMSKRTKNLSEVHWSVREMTFPAGFFDVVIDKCTLDTLLCTDCSYTSTARMTREVQKVLKKKRRFFSDFLRNA
jgi:2-polyprenyl-3-methyl-5-hydroxy-6-metoxy-1,4-benzoquinol methylase